MGSIARFCPLAGERAGAWAAARGPTALNHRDKKEKAVMRGLDPRIHGAVRASGFMDHRVKPGDDIFPIPLCLCPPAGALAKAGASVVQGHWAPPRGSASLSRGDFPPDMGFIARFSCSAPRGRS